MRNLSNISVAEFRKILTQLGYTRIRTNGGHEAWGKADILRPIIFQTHVEPIPEFIVRNCLRNIGISKQEFIQMLENA